jgi:hypothetical protein
MLATVGNLFIAALQVFCISTYVIYFITPSSVTEEMNPDQCGVFQLRRIAYIIFSFDHKKVVIGSKQLARQEFKALIGCNMATSGIPP